MKAAQILESGLAGAATLTLLSETLNKINSNSPNTNLFHRKGIVRHLKKGMRKKGFKAVKMYVSVAAELLSIAGALGISGLGKKKKCCATRRPRRSTHRNRRRVFAKCSGK